MVQLTRRKFLVASGCVGGGLTVLYTLGIRAAASAPTIIFPDENSGAAWIQIRPSGACHMYLPRQDMGQNANTGLAQIVAEELNILVADIIGERPTTSDVPPLAVTAASMSLTAFCRPVALAAATLRESLRTRAAAMLGDSLVNILDDPGGFRTAKGRKVGYSELVSGRGVVIEFDETKSPPPLYTFDPSRQKKQIGHSVRPLDIQALVTGAPVYAADVQVEGVLYGRAVQPPVRNARIRSLDTQGVMKTQGLVKLVHEGDFVGVVCKTPSAVDAAMAQIKVTWNLDQPINQLAIDSLIDVDAEMMDGDLEHVLQNEAHRDTVDWDIDLRFEVQTQTHAQQEARAAIARFNESTTAHSLEIWTGTQDPWAIKRAAAVDTGLSQDDVVVYPQRLGGGFGGREYYEVERDAVRLARAVKRPVKVQWTRQDEFTASRCRPASTHRLRIAVDDGGNLSDWWYGYVSGHVALARERMAGWLLPMMRLGTDMGVVKGAIAPYAAPHQRVECTDVDLPIDLGVWRSLNGAPAVFAIESAMDELAIQRGQDSLQYRLAQMKGAHPRLQACFERVSEMSTKNPLPEGDNYGRGFAGGIFDGRCYVAVSADVHIDAETQKIRVLHMCCAQDVGLAVNPGQLRAQIESNLVWSIGMALLERFEVADNAIQSSNFNDYQIPRMIDMPSLDIEIIDQPAIPPAGAGEVALIAGPPAIANAIRNACDFRAVKLPIAFDDITANSRA